MIASHPTVDGCVRGARRGLAFVRLADMGVETLRFVEARGAGAR